jgi:hypothetical protein
MLDHVRAPRLGSSRLFSNRHALDRRIRDVKDFVSENVSLCCPGARVLLGEFCVLPKPLENRAGVWQPRIIANGPQTLATGDPVAYRISDCGVVF